MSIDRRSFLYAGGMTAAATPFATSAHAAASQGARSVTDFGVEPNVDRDQTDALQKAIDELSRAGQAIILPGGRYVTGPLKLPKICALAGTPHMTVLRAKGEDTVLSGARITALHLSGIAFERAETSKTGTAAIDVSGAALHIAHCGFRGRAGIGMRLENCSGTVEAVDIENALATGIWASEAAGLTISGCRISKCQGSGIAISGTGGQVQGFGVTQNQIAECGVAIAAEGTGIVSDNILTGAARFGLKLGNAKSQGSIVAQSNLIRDCRIGIGVASSGDDIMAALNMIVGAKDGAIRAFDGDRLVGPDLVRQSTESYLNLMVAGNVVR